MASEAVGRVRRGLFRGGNISNDDGLPRSEPALTINIPAVPSTPRLPAAAPPKSTKVSNPSPDDDELDAHQQQDNRSYREHLASRIGADYKGVEISDVKDTGNVGALILATVNGPRFAKITRPTEMPGVIFLMNTRDLVLTFGAKTVLLEFPTIINAFASPSLWNGKDPILKERLEDVKELYYYLDSTPSHSYMKFLYKYPQRRYPYEELVTENRNRSRDVAGYEILDSDTFNEDSPRHMYYAKDEDEPDNIYIRITAYNRGPDPATLHIIPQLWFPNTWSWPLEKPPMPSLTAHNCSGINYIAAKHPDQPKTHLYRLPSPPPVGPNGNFDVDPETEAVEPELLFTENNTNFSRLYGVDDDEVEEGPCTPFPSGPDFVNPNKTGTKSAAHYIFKDVPSQGGCSVVRLKLTPLSVKKDLSIEDKGIFDDVVEAHRREADEFYNSLVFGPMSDDFKQIVCQVLGEMLQTKRYYKFIQKEWLEGDPAQPPPPERKFIRNWDWRYMHVVDVLSMPDKQVVFYY
ncbi:uncharacterized protein C8R40DRAFT_1074449 [Lentinula edodes]|uniref:uncharacterized protein n=1 Tax=Lentinula edodes TaxID=5353 RepID=UPI001E8D1462|nr:uncharacterized protein C8R40DRAFT_1074449 [Lentinula edodes]KAH7868974.1 hypothetical protein C8R40DRAFT_1074449 [Lentinula edodes]